MSHSIPQYSPSQPAITAALECPYPAVRIERLLSLQTAYLQGGDKAIATEIRDFYIHRDLISILEDPDTVETILTHPEAHLVGALLLAKRVAAVFDYQTPQEGLMRYEFGTPDGFLISLSRHCRKSSFIPPHLRIPLTDEWLQIMHCLKDIPSTAAKILRGELVNVPYGMGKREGHIVDLIFYQGGYFICNGEPSPFEFRTLKGRGSLTIKFPISDTITQAQLEEMLRMISQGNDLTLEEGRNFVYQTLPRLLAPQRAPTPLLHKTTVLLPATSSANCYFSSFECGLYQSARLLDGNKQTLKDIKNVVLEYKLTCFDDYLSHLKRRNAANDPLLIKYVFSQIKEQIKKNGRQFKHCELATMLATLPTLQQALCERGFLDYRSRLGWYHLPCEMKPVAIEEVEEKKE